MVPEEGLVPPQADILVNGEWTLVGRGSCWVQLGQQEREWGEGHGWCQGS